ncbi:glycosyltransferase family 4 protein [Sediminicola arcticus]|uniref:Glycosyltransferase family 4 protein n=1 Tax=Sediminicola arcticus TaxID=1574308 RepID=A0ABV2SV10_9FLAO
MKIDFIINKMSGGGAERVVSLVANYLNNKGYEIRIITFQGSDKYELDKGIKRIKLHKHPFFQSVVVNGFFGLSYFYRKKSNRPDIISSHINLLGYMTIPIAKIFNIKIIVSEHINHSQNNSFSRRFLWNYLYSYSDAVTILTNYDLEYFSKKNKNVLVMPNPCPFSIIKDADILRERNKEIIAVGNLDRYFHKGFDNLITIASKVLIDNPNWKLRIVGGGDDGLKILKNKSIELGVEDKIIFNGFTSEVREIMLNSEIFILSSRFEGLPMVLMEAMSQGMCCISYDCISGPSDIIDTNINGNLIENQNIDKMIIGLNELIQNNALRQKFKKNAPRSLNKFSIETIGSKWEKLLKELVIKS